MTTQPAPVPLDPRRYFTAAEVTAAWLLQDRTCRDCGRDVPRDLVEGDHIVAWSRGGPTTMENLQALCIACNRRKGIREGVVNEKLAAAVAPSTAPLRRWQERALETVLSATGPVLIEACPADSASVMAADLMMRGYIQRPTLQLSPRQHDRPERQTDPEQAAGVGRLVQAPSQHVWPGRRAQQSGAADQPAPALASTASAAGISARTVRP